jgi:uncharacterized RDD family membrane protein YckC
MTLPRTPSTTRAATHLRTRIGGYAVDMVIFAAIAMVMTVLAGFILLFRINWGTDDPSDAELYAFLGIIALGLPFVWTALNISLLATRGQTGGQYVAGLRLQREDGGTLTPRDAILWWFCMNPVLLSWPMAIMVGLPIAFFLLTVLVRVMIFVWALLILLCIVSPLIALISAALDSHNRTLHDRIVGVVAVPAE